MSDRVLIRYGRVDVEKARRCERCPSWAHEKHPPGAACPRCKGTGIRPGGWAYWTGGLDVSVGDVVEVPKTPRSAGPVEATVIQVGDVEHLPRATLIRIVERAS